MARFFCPPESSAEPDGGSRRAKPRPVERLLDLGDHRRSRPRSRSGAAGGHAEVGQRIVLTLPPSRCSSARISASIDCLQVARRRPPRTRSSRRVRGGPGRSSGLTAPINGCWSRARRGPRRLSSRPGLEPQEASIFPAPFLPINPTFSPGLCCQDAAPVDVLRPSRPLPRSRIPMQHVSSLSSAACPRALASRRPAVVSLG